MEGDMAEEGSSLRARRNVKRAFAVGMTGLAMLVVGLQGVAIAAAEVTITQPAQGTLTNKRQVSFKGTGVGPIIELYVSKMRLEGGRGVPVWTREGTSGKWETSQEFPDGQYCTLAVQRTPPIGEKE